MSTPPENLSAPWWRGVTRYQWLVLAIASAGWIFDTFEGQIFNLTRRQMLEDILGAGATPAAISQWGDIFLGIFLAGGTLGGILFGWLGDVWGRRPAMIVTILMYSVFSGLTYFASELWQVGVLRFLVAMGVGGEWAVAAALVSEVFPARARAHAGGISTRRACWGRGSPRSRASPLARSGGGPMCWVCCRRCWCSGCAPPCTSRNRGARRARPRPRVTAVRWGASATCC
jgi:hypothetical protein